MLKSVYFLILSTFRSKESKGFEMEVNTQKWNIKSFFEDICMYKNKFFLFKII